MKSNWDKGDHHRFDTRAIRCWPVMWRTLTFSLREDLNHLGYEWQYRQHDAESIIHYLGRRMDCFPPGCKFELSSQGREQFETGKKKKPWGTVTP